MARIACIGLDGGASAHVNRLGMRDSRITALVTTTDQDLSTACAARGQDVRIKQAHLVTCGQHAAGFLSRPRTHIQGAPEGHGARTHAAQQHDGALAVFHSLRLHDTGVVHGIGQQVACHLRAHEHLTTIGLQQATIAQQRLCDALLHMHIQQLVTQHIQRHGLSSGQRHTAPLGRHGAPVIHMRTEQSHVAAVCSTQDTLVDQLCCARTRKPITPSHEVDIGGVQRRRHQSTHIDRRAQTEHDPIGVDEEHLAGG